MSPTGRVLRGCLISASVFAVTAVGLVIFGLIQLNGGLPWAFTTAPKATDANVVAANTAGNMARDLLVTELRAAGVSAGLVPVTATTPVLDCREGQHNWKINSSYDLQCDTTVTVILGSTYPSETALRTQLLALHDQLTAHGWRSVYAETTTLPSIRDALNQPEPPGTPGTRPFLAQNRHATYVHGTQRGQGSATIALHFGDAHDWSQVRSPLTPYGISTQIGGWNAYRATETYLAGGSKYVVSLGLAYVTFSG